MPPQAMLAWVRLSPYNAYYHNWQTLNFTASDSSSDDIVFLQSVNSAAINATELRETEMFQTANDDLSGYTQGQ